MGYRLSRRDAAHVFVGISVSGPDDIKHFEAKMKRTGYAYSDLSAEDTAKEHIRHMVGGPSPLANNERVLRFVFPERPGALLKFLSHMRPTWNISLFHYRNQGADYGKVLVGLQVPQADAKPFQSFLDTLGYQYVEETDNPAYRLFLRS